VMQAESGGDPTAYNQSSGASGLFGDLLSTWLSLGLGYPGGAYTAPAGVQLEGFAKLYAEAGMSPWDADGCPQRFGEGAQVISARLLSDVRATRARGPGGGARHPRRYSRRFLAFEWAIKNTPGCPYSWGGNGCYPGYDCSGLVVRAYKTQGITLPRTTEEMAASRQLIRIPMRKARKGDLAMWFSGGQAVHVELVVWVHHRHVVYGAMDPQDGIGYATFGPGWMPGAFYAVRGAG
jgi:hypothetical protein